MRRRVALALLHEAVRAGRARSRAPRIVGLLLAGFALHTGTLAGQVSLGIQGEWGSEAEFGMGGRVIVGIRPLPRALEVVGSFDYFIPDRKSGAELTHREINGNLVYRFGGIGPLTPYAGVGLNVARFDASTRVLGVTVSGGETEKALNVLGGVILSPGRIRPFIEGRVATREAREFVVAAGVRFPR